MIITDKEIQIINQDCFEFLPTIKDNSIDLILIDPPYLISRDSGFICNTSKAEYASKYGKHKIDFGEWDKIELPIDKILKESYRILKPSGTFIMFFDIWKMGGSKKKQSVVGLNSLAWGVGTRQIPYL